MDLIKSKSKHSSRIRSLTKTQNLIVKECDSIRDLLLEKNRSYGDSFSRPIGIFAAGHDADVQIRVRIDDKLARISRGTEYSNEDTITDLIGYLILLRLLVNVKKKKH